MEGLYYLCSENKAPISFAVTAKLICVFVFEFAKIWFSHDEAKIMQTLLQTHLIQEQSGSSLFTILSAASFGGIA